MDFTKWLAGNGYDEAALTAPMRKHLEAAWKAEQQPPPVNPPEKVGDPGFDEKMKLWEEKAALRVHIDQSIEAAIKVHADRGNQEKMNELKEMRIAAYADDKMTQQKFDLALLRLERRLPTMVMAPTAKQASDDVLEAAICMSCRLPEVEDKFSEQSLEAAHKQFKHGIGLKELLVMAAERNSGYKGSARDLPAVFRAAFRPGAQHSDDMMATGWGPSTISVSGILSNVANKFMFVGFNAIDTAWRSLAATRAVNDYKQITTLGLTGDLQYAELPPSGEIKHGTLGETTYTNQATVFARMLGLDERDIRNDDLGAFSQAANRLGRGGALALNHRFWTIFLNNSAFFTAGNSNVITGASSVLTGATGLGALALADEKFRLQTDPDGKPLGSTPRKLVVPTALRVGAMNLMNSTTVVGTTTANSMMPDQNIFAGAFDVVSSPYLQNSAYTGFSATAWYLLADPNDLPVIEVVFLDGIETPTVESADADFNMLGIQMRGVIKFGVALQEHRGGVRAAGA